METVPVAAQDDSSGATPSSVKSDDSSPRHDSGRGSPPPNCAICLGHCRNKSFTDSCLHQFCFKCLLTWSKVKAECPLCKQSFRSIIHNVRSNHQYEEYMVDQQQTEDAIQRETDSMADYDNVLGSTRRFRYRTTLTLPRHETIAIQQLLLRHYPIMADVFPPPAPGRAPPARRRSSAAFRRTVYRHNLWARPLPDFTGRFRDCSPIFYRYNTSQMHRLVPWLNRELHYLLSENFGHISYVISRIMELLTQFHITSTEFRQAIEVYFRDRTEHFLHELHCFASTPYDMTGYDRNVQYTTDTRISTMVNEVLSSSESEGSVDSDIVMVSSSAPAEPPAGPSRPPPPPPPAPVYPLSYIPVPPAQNNVIPIETISHSDTDDDSSEVMVVGYIKPPQDRTPEVVDLLGSDSDVIVQETSEPQPQTSGNQETRPSPLVKLILKRHATQDNPDSDSDDSNYQPPPTRRKKRQRSNHTATTSDTTRTTPSPVNEPLESPLSPTQSSSSYNTFVRTTPSSTSTSSSSITPDSSSSESSSRKRKVTKKNKYKRKHRETSSSDRKKSKKPKYRSCSHPKDNKDNETLKNALDQNRKSTSGKGVKTTKRKQSSSTPEEQATSNDQPSTSSSSSSNYRHKSNENRKRRRPSRESRRLKSVVNVMYNQKPGETSGSSLTLNQDSTTTSSSSSDNMMPQNRPTPSYNTEVPSTSQTQASNFDSEDDLPLNLSVHLTSL